MCENKQRVHCCTDGHMTNHQQNSDLAKKARNYPTVWPGNGAHVVRQDRK